MRSGDRPGLQNRRAAGFPVAGGFDSHSLPPFIFNWLVRSFVQPFSECDLGPKSGCCDKNVIEISREIASKIQDDPYRFLICADKFQTGYDEPLLHTMYVDKPLSGVKAVQTLSRLNRAHPQKHDVFVLDFQNKADAIQASFEPYYRTTILSSETDPNKLHDLKASLDGYQVYSWAQVDELMSLFLSGAGRERLDPIL